jgi:hypothetical protein
MKCISMHYPATKKSISKWGSEETGNPRSSGPRVFSFCAEQNHLSQQNQALAVAHCPGCLHKIARKKNPLTLGQRVNPSFEGWRRQVKL